MKNFLHLLMLIATKLWPATGLLTLLLMVCMTVSACATQPAEEWRPINQVKK